MTEVGQEGSPGLRGAEGGRSAGIPDSAPVVQQGTPDSPRGQVRPDVDGQGSADRAPDRRLPLVSIIIPTYNRARWIKECVESALTQTYPNIEVLVVDDGSTDETGEIIKAFTDPRLRYIKKEHTGGPGTRNCGILHAKGDFILWLGSDDILMRRTVERAVAILQTFPEADVVYGDRYVMDEKGKRTGRIDRREDYWENDLISSLLLDPFGDGGAMVRRSLYLGHGLFNEQFTRCHDYEFWSRTADKARFKHAGCFVYQRRIHDFRLGGPRHLGVRDTDTTNYGMKIVERLVACHPIRRLFPAFFRGDQVLGECRAYLALAHICMRRNCPNKAHFYFREAARRFQVLGRRGRHAIGKELDTFLHISYLSASPYSLAEALTAARSFPLSFTSWRRLAMAAIPGVLREPLCRIKEAIFEREA